MLAQTDIIVTADHAMAPAVRTLSSQTLNKIIQLAGGQPLYVGHGDYSPIWLKNVSAVPRVAARLAGANLPGVAAVYAKTPTGRYVLASQPSRLADPAVQQAYQDLLLSFDSPESPDIVLLYDENTITMTPTFLRIGRKGDHGGATWGAQHIPLILEGPGVKQGYTSAYPARLVDIAPTLETLLGVSPQHQDGIPLADAMVSPPPEAAAEEVKHLGEFTADVDNLEREAALRPNVSR
jgi:arylsulfatase A-like enzyme